MGIEVHRQGDLDISQNMDVQWRIWKMQRMGWGIMALAILSILLGLTGRGPLSNASAGQTGAPLRLEYERFGRYEAPTSLRIHLGSTLAKTDKIRLWISRDYMEKVRIDHVSPEQESVKAQPDKFVYEFELSSPQSPTIITIRLKPQKVGILKGQVGVEKARTLSFQHFIYP